MHTLSDVFYEHVLGTICMHDCMLHGLKDNMGLGCWGLYSDIEHYFSHFLYGSMFFL